MMWMKVICALDLFLLLLLLRSPALNSGGRSTGHNSDITNSARIQLPNPYLELAQKVSLATRDNEESLPQLQTQTSSTRAPPPEGDSGRGAVRIDIQINEKPAVGNKAADTAENILRAHDDDADDEEGNAQVYPSESQDIMPEQLDMLKVLHQAKMEEISKLVRPRKIMLHLQSSGYFNYNYNIHARTTLDNLNLRQGQKKPIERLLTLLSIY